MNWKPIESVPHNEPVLLARNGPIGWQVVAGFYDEGADVLDYPWPFIDPECSGNLNSFHTDHGPSHWMPLPAPPAP
ncbi:DUF551 domain-containing protein [Mesorhizobium sp. M7D.F.Ca.US.005.01.1.1]|nr:DUF551 domain-containing protein [Mesorhizobium sp. M7D.F.Ca.US.005.01.1.1]